MKHTSLEERHQQQQKQQAYPASGAQQDLAAMTLQMQKLQVSQPKSPSRLRFEGECVKHSCCSRSAAAVQLDFSVAMSDHARIRCMHFHNPLP